MRRFFFATGLLATILLSVGCSSSAPNGAAPATRVSGYVKLDGKPVENGEVHFTVSGYPPRALEISEGRYAGEAPIGNNEVQVFIFKVGPPMEKYGGQRLKTNISPKKYWGPKTTLDARVTPDGANHFDFDLNSK